MSLSNTKYHNGVHVRPKNVYYVACDLYPHIYIFGYFSACIYIVYICMKIWATCTVVFHLQESTPVTLKISQLL